MKKISAVIASSLLLVLAACSSPRPEPQSSSSGADDPAANVQLGVFESKAVNITLEPNETKDLEVFVFPTVFKVKDVKYVSSDKEIVEVSDSGKMTAKKVGNAKITVSCGTFSTTCYIHVGKKVDFENVDEKAKLTEIATANQTFISSEEFVPTSFLKIKEKSYSEILRTKTVDGKEVTEKAYDSLWYEDMIISKEDAYFSISDSFDSTSRVDQGAPSYSASSWIFYCTESFETFAFHESNEGKKYMVIDCSAHSDRYAALTEVLKNIFTNITDIIAGQFDNINTTQEMEMVIDCLGHDYSNVKWNNAYIGDEEKMQMSASYDISFNDEFIDAEMSQNMGIPSGVTANITQSYDSYLSDGYMQYQNIYYVYDYDYRGAHVSDRSHVDRTYTLEPEELRYPDIKGEGWKEAEDIFEL